MLGVLLLASSLAADDRPPPRAVLEGVSLPERRLIQLSSEVASEGRASSRVRVDDASVVLFYGSEQEGELGSCGCPSRPKGGLPRVAHYVATSRKANPSTPTLLLNAGNWLDDTIGIDGAIRPDVSLANLRMLEGASGWDVLNVGFQDLAWLETHGFPATTLSSTLQGSGGPARALRFERGEHEVVVLGVSGPGDSFAVSRAFEWVDPVAALSAVPLRQEDLVIVLAIGVTSQAERLAAVPGVDVVIEAGGYDARYEPERVGDAIWVRSRHQTQRLGELRLWIHQGQVIKALDRRIDLDARIGEDRSLARFARKSDDEVKALQQEVFASWQ